MELIHTAALWLATNIHPAAPFAALTFAIWLGYYLSRKFWPGLWAFADAYSPDGTVASKVVQGLPALLIGALITACTMGLDLKTTFLGALAGAAAPFTHELMKRYKGAVKAPPQSGAAS